jgi:hypothetical protein
MPSFDIVSEINSHELDNAINQTNQEIARRFDLKDSGAKVSFEENKITITADDKFHVDQVKKTLESRLIARKIDIRSLKEDKLETSLSEARQHFTLLEGIDTPNGKKINQLIKSSKIKAQSSIMENKVRVTAKKRDDLQTIMEMLKAEKFELPLQFNNFRD